MGERSRVLRKRIQQRRRDDNSLTVSVHVPCSHGVTSRCQLRVTAQYAPSGPGVKVTHVYASCQDNPSDYASMAVLNALATAGEVHVNSCLDAKDKLVELLRASSLGYSETQKLLRELPGVLTDVVSAAASAANASRSKRQRPRVKTPVERRVHAVNARLQRKVKELPTGWGFVVAAPASDKLSKLNVLVNIDSGAWVHVASYIGRGRFEMSTDGARRLVHAAEQYRASIRGGKFMCAACGIWVKSLHTHHKSQRHADNVETKLYTLLDRIANVMQARKSIG